MKLTKLEEYDLAAIAVSLAESPFDADDTEEKATDQIGAKLGIDAVAGEGYNTTVWRVCRIIVDYEPVSAYDRIVEMMSTISTIMDIDIPDVTESTDLNMLATTLRAMDNRDAQAMGEGIQTILKQHKKYAN